MWSWKHGTDNLTNWAGAVRGVASLRNWYLGWDVKDGGWIKLGESDVWCARVHSGYRKTITIGLRRGGIQDSWGARRKPPGGPKQKQSRGQERQACEEANESASTTGTGPRDPRHGTWPSCEGRREGASERHGTPYSARSSHEPQPTATPRFEALRGRTTWPPDGTPFCHYGAPKNPSAVIPESRLLHENATRQNSNREERGYSDRSHCRKII